MAREVFGEGFSHRYRGATLAALPRRQLDLPRLNEGELPEAAGAEVAVAPVALPPREHAEEPLLPAAASTGRHEGSTPCGLSPCEQKCPEQPGRPSLASAVGFAVARSAFCVGLALSSTTQDLCRIAEQRQVKSSTLTAICCESGSTPRFPTSENPGRGSGLLNRGDGGPNGLPILGRHPA